MMRTRVTGGFLVAALASIWAQESPSVTAVRSAVRERRFEDALSSAKAALAQSPNDAPMLTLEGLAFQGLGRGGEALASFDGALRVDSKYLPALEGAAQLRYQADQDGAIPLLDRILELRPGEEPAHAMRAVMAARRKDCVTAVRHFDASRPAIASQAAALDMYGRCLVRLNQPSSAAGIYRQLLKIEPGNRLARQRLAVLEVMQQRYAEAAALLEPILARPEDAGADVLALAADAYERTGDTPRAVTLLRQAILKAPANVQLYLDFGLLCFVHDSFKVGVDVLTLGIEQVPSSPDLYLARAILYVQLGLLDKADADYAQAERLDPRQSSSSVARVLTEFQHDDVDRSLASVRHELARHPDDAFLQYLLAEILAWQGAQPGSPEFAEAEKAAMRALALKPDLALARNVLSRLYLAAGRTSEAIAQCHLALRDDPSDEVAMYRLIRALKMTGRKEDADQVPGLLKKFSEIKQKARDRDVKEHHYRLFIGDEKGTSPKP